MKNKLILILAIVVGYLAILFPQFYFNELELGFRQNFSNAYISIDKAEQGISLRQQGPENVDEETFASLGKAIENELDNALSSLEEASLYNSKQEKISFLLPNKYKQYLELKQSSLLEYHQLSESFHNRKQNEHLMTETMMLLVRTDQSINDTSNKDQWIQTLKEVPVVVGKINANAERLLSSNHINQEFYDYILLQTKKFEYLYDSYANLMETDTWNVAEFEKGLENYYFPEEELVRITNESKLEWNQQRQEHLNKLTKNDQNLLEASNYYNENKLAFDPVSRLLSMFTNKYPRIKTTENHEPTIIPVDAPIEVLSYLGST